MVKSQFRVVWKRTGLKRRERIFGREATARRFLLLFGPEPWLAYLKPGQTPDDEMCCSGYQCGCSGETFRQQSEARRATQPALEFVRLEQRPVGAWGMIT